MRTTGLRRAPLSAPRNSWIEISSTESTPRTSLIFEDPEEGFIKDHKGVTLRVISVSIPSRDSLVQELAKLSQQTVSDQSKPSTALLTPPPKPPRTYSYHSPLEKEEPESSQNSDIALRPITPTALSLLKRANRVPDVPLSGSHESGSDQLIQSVISSPDISNQLGSRSIGSSFGRSLSVRSSSNLSRDRASTSASPLGALFTETKMAWRSFRRRPQNIPPPPSVRPPATPLAPPEQPSSNMYPSLEPNSQYAQRNRTNITRTSGLPPTPTRPGPSVLRPGSSGSSTSSSPIINNKGLDQGAISSPREFEGTCLEALKLSKNARSFMDKNQYNQAACQYQLALGCIDRILKTKVLDVTPHEPTRQRFFQMQEAIFATRKECLNGFSDAQAAVAVPQCLSTTSPPPGAPPSYQDVLREDRRRTRGEPPPLPERPANLNRPPQASQSAQAQPTSRNTAQVQPQSQSQPSPQSQTQVPPRHSQPSPQSQPQAPPRHSQPSPQSQLQTPPRHSQPSPQSQFQAPPRHSQPSPQSQLQEPPRHSQPSPQSQLQAPPRHSQPSPQSQLQTPPRHSQPSPQSQLQTPTRHSQPPPLVAHQAVVLPEAQTPPRLPQRQPNIQNFSSSHPLADPMTPAPRLPPRIQSHTDSATNVQPQATPQKPPRPRHSQPRSQSAAQSPLEPSKPQNEFQEQPKLQPTLESQQHGDLYAQAQALVPPKPLPRYSLPSEAKKRSHGQPRPLSKLQPHTENISQMQNSSEVQDKLHISNQEKEPQSFVKAKESALPVFPQIQDQRQRPAYLRNNNQPIGDLLRQASREKLEPVSTRPKVSHSISRDDSDDTALAAEAKNESQTDQNKSGLYRFNPLNQQKMYMPMSQSKIYQEEPIRLHPRLSPVTEDPTNIYENTQDMTDHGKEIKSISMESKKENKEVALGIPPSEIFNKSSPDGSLSQVPTKHPIAPPRAQKRTTSDVKTQLPQEPIESLYSVPAKPAKTFVTDKSHATVHDPFSTIDPFPLAVPSSTQVDVHFSVDISPSHAHKLLDSSNVEYADKSSSATKPIDKSSQLPTPIKPMQASGVILQPVVLSAQEEKLPKDKTPIEAKNANGLTKGNSGDSILDALDFAVTPKHQKVSMQKSKEVMYLRSHSQESLLDFSFNTLDRYLKTSTDPQKKQQDMCRSRASIIEEFDPLISLTPEKHDGGNVADITLTPSVEVTGSNQTITPSEGDELGEDYYSVPRKLKWESADDLCDEIPEEPPLEKVKERTIADFPPDIYVNTAGEAESTPEEPIDPNAKYNYPGSPYHIYAELGAGSSIVSSESSASWSPEVNRFSATPPLTSPSTASTSDQNPWKSLYANQEDSEDEQVVGRSAFYRTTSTDQGSHEESSSSSSLPPVEGALGGSASASGTHRELLKIREGVKIYFIHEDGIITSPWNKPFLSITKDPSTSWHGQCLLLRVGKSLWSCELISKQTLVFKTESGTYLFKETNNKPECVAVAVCIPSSVRKIQHELLSKIMHENTELEIERPSGLTKSISKSAATAASRVNRIVGDDTPATDTAFIRRNSIRALKGMSKRLSSLAIKTGSTLPELPPEYESLQNAAITLRFSKTAKTIQYI